MATDDSIWFSDPTFGIDNPAESYGGTSAQDGEFIYRYAPKDKSLTRMKTPMLHSPNSLAFSPDARCLYIADSQLAHNFSDPTLAHRILAYEVHNHELMNGRVFAEINPGIPDGIKVDECGNVWSSCKEGIQVFNPSGTLLGKVLINSENTGNLNFSSDGLDHWLYVTAAHLVFRLKVKVSGAVSQ